jgi:hypothetical protein
MATIKEQEELIQTLKFTPRNYRIELGAYGGEIYIGSVDRKIYDYFQENNIDIEEYANSWDNELEVPEEFQPFTPGSAYDCDNLIHANGATMDNGNTVEVFDENGDMVWSCSLDPSDLEAAGVEVEQDEEFYTDSLADGEVAFCGSQGEKGLLFGGEIELKQPFDPKKLKISYCDADGWYLSSGIMYDDEDVDNMDYSTSGKWSENKWVTNGNEDIFEPSDNYDVPESGPSPDDWEKSPKFKFKKHKPVHQGWYKVNWGYGSTYGSLYWNGTNFVEFNYGKEDIVSDDSIVYWQGYNWDTSDWANQPPQPPNIICDNKKCGWVGLSEDRITDEAGDDHCPDCNGTEFSWIDYDPDTKEGKANRKKYCRTKSDVADLEKALEELKAEFEALCEAQEI